MAGDDDIAAQLPEPPPSAPLRRRQAIDEAMRRFDAAQGVDAMAEPLRAPAAKAPWWTGIGRPQAAALVTAGLVALLGVPAAWLSVSQRSAPVDQPQLASSVDHLGKLAIPTASSASVAESSLEAPPAAGPASASPAKPEQSSAASSTILAEDDARAR